MSILHPRQFLVKFSLHIGVVTICAMGIMLMAVSFFINVVQSDPETSNLIFSLHWFIVLFVLCTGLVIYTLGMVAAYKGSSNLAVLTAIFLSVHCAIWALLTGTSFVNNMDINRYICIDNRCADRLFMKNGNWRRADILCKNPSLLRWRLSGQELPNIGVYGSISNRLNTDNLNHHSGDVDFDYLYDSDSDSIPSTSEKYQTEIVGRRRMQYTTVKDYTISKEFGSDTKSVTASETTKKYHLIAEERKNVLQRESGMIKQFNQQEDEDWTENSSMWVKTPLGYVGCNSPQHIAFSVVYAILILLLWYVYPIIIIFSYGKHLKRRETEDTTSKNSQSQESDRGNIRNED